MTQTADFARWREAWRALGVDDPPAALFQHLQTRYGEPHRAYHTVQHIRDCLAHFDRVRHLAERPADVAMAIWFHDAIYEPQRSDNEERSAQWAQDALVAAGVDPAVGRRVADLVLLTKHDRTPESPDAKLLLDIDLAILGAEPDRFDEYEQQIRREYAWVPWAVFCRRRAAILRGFLQRPAIYWTAYFAQRLETQARINLQRSLARLVPNRGG